MPEDNANRIKLLGKIHAVMCAVDFIKDDKSVSVGGGYSYASEEAIKRTVAPLLRKHKLLFVLDTMNQQVVDKLTTVDSYYHFIDVETGDEITGPFCSQGSDSGEKGIWKAVTGAIKYIMTTTFFIPTGDDPEKPTADAVSNFVKANRDAPPPPAAPAGQAIDRNRRVTSTGPNTGRAYYVTPSGAFSHWEDEQPPTG